MQPSSGFIEMTERMIAISKQKPLLPEHFVPWQDEPDAETLFMPHMLVSLHGHELWHTLSDAQKIELGRLEIVQVMYSYAWSETLACLFFNRHLLSLPIQSVEYRFLIRETIEEFRHQEMFGMAIEKLARKPELPTRIHRLFGHFTARFFPPSMVFMNVLAIELMADIYAKHIRKDPKVYSVLRKVSELHHIEEGRHIFYTKAFLERYTAKAGFFKRSLYSLIVLFSVYFMQTLYVKEDFFKAIKVDNSKKYYRAAKAHYRSKFPEFALAETLSFVEEIKGFNWFTKPIWRAALKVKI